MYLEYYVGIQLFLHTGAANAQAYEVMLSSNLSAELTAYPQQTVMFTCVSRDAGILNWLSDEYIGTDSLPLQISSIGSTTTVQSNTHPNTVATRINVTYDNGTLVIVSELRIVTF